MRIIRIEDLLNCDTLHETQTINFQLYGKINQEFMKNKNTILNKISNCVNLSCLDLTFCNINDLSFLEGMRNLKYLLLRKNEIKDISNLKSVIPNLNNLDLEYNQISDFSVLNQPNRIKNLMIKHNKNSNGLDFSNFMSLEYLTIDNQKNSKTIENIQKHAENNKKFTELRLTGYLSVNDFLNLEKNHYFKRFKNNKLEFLEDEYYLYDKEITKKTFLKLLDKTNN